MFTSTVKYLGLRLVFVQILNTRPCTLILGIRVEAGNGIVVNVEGEFYVGHSIPPDCANLSHGY